MKPAAECAEDQLSDVCPFNGKDSQHHARSHHKRSLCASARPLVLELTQKCHTCSNVNSQWLFTACRFKLHALMYAACLLGFV